MTKIMGIIGGMGPLATALFFKRIVELTEANCDQDHLRILIDNNPLLPDRSTFIMGRGDNPLNQLLRSAQCLEANGADFLVMPCNSAHYFYYELQRGITIPLLNIIEITAKIIKKKYALATSTKIFPLGLLATEGTISSNIYDDVFLNYGLKVIKPHSANQSLVSDLIENVKGGKEKPSLAPLEGIIKEMGENGVKAIILGCTELSLLCRDIASDLDFIDPLELLARESITFAGKKIKGERK